MTEPSNTTRAKAHAKAAADKAASAANEAKEAVTETTAAVADGARSGFAAVRNSEEVQRVVAGVRSFARRVEDPLLVGLFVANPLVGAGATGVVKGGRLLVRGLRAEGAVAEARVDTDSSGK